MGPARAVARRRLVRGVGAILTSRFRIRRRIVAPSTPLLRALSLSDLSLISIIILISGGFNIALANPSFGRLGAFRSFCSLVVDQAGNGWQRAIRQALTQQVFQVQFLRLPSRHIQGAHHMHFPLTNDHLLRPFHAPHRTNHLILWPPRAPLQHLPLNNRALYPLLHTKTSRRQPNNRQRQRNKPMWVQVQRLQHFPTSTQQQTQHNSRQHTHQLLKRKNQILQQLHPRGTPHSMQHQVPTSRGHRKRTLRAKKLRNSPHRQKQRQISPTSRKNTQRRKMHLLSKQPLHQEQHRNANSLRKPRNPLPNKALHHHQRIPNTNNVLLYSTQAQRTLPLRLQRSKSTKQRGPRHHTQGLHPLTQDHNRTLSTTVIRFLSILIIDTYDVLLVSTGHRASPCPICPLKVSCLGACLRHAVDKVHISATSYGLLASRRLTRHVHALTPHCVKISLHGISNTGSLSQQKFLPRCGTLVSIVHTTDSTPLVVNKTKFSVCPRTFVQRLKTSCNVRNRNRKPLTRLVKTLRQNRAKTSVPTICAHSNHAKGKPVKGNPTRGHLSRGRHARGAPARGRHAGDPAKGRHAKGKQHDCLPTVRIRFRPRLAKCC